MSIQTMFRCDGCNAETPEATAKGVTDIPIGWGVLTVVVSGSKRVFTQHWCPGCVEERASNLGLA